MLNTSPLILDNPRGRFGCWGGGEGILVEFWKKKKTVRGNHGEMFRA